MSEMDNVQISEHTIAKEWFSQNVLERCAARGIDPRWMLDERLVNAIEQIRAHFNKPVLINYNGSELRGFRTGYENAMIEESAEFSQHQYGRAADITIPTVTSTEIANYAAGVLKLYTRIYPTWCHIDCRWM